MQTPAFERATNRFGEDAAQKIFDALDAMSVTRREWSVDDDLDLLAKHRTGEGESPATNKERCHMYELRRQLPAQIVEMIDGTSNTSLAMQTPAFERAANRFGEDATQKIFDALDAMSVTRREWSVDDDLDLLAKHRTGESELPATDRERCHMYELRRQLPAQIIEIIDGTIDDASLSDYNQELVCNLSLAPFRLDFDVETKLTVPTEHERDTRQPLPFGALAYRLPAGPFVAKIPEQWPLRIAPSQFVIESTSVERDFDERPFTDPYLVDDISKPTRISDIMRDVGDFLRHHGVPCAPEGPTFLKDAPNAPEPIPVPAEQTAEEADFFNVGTGADGVTLIVLVPATRMPAAPAEPRSPIVEWPVRLLSRHRQCDRPRQPPHRRRSQRRDSRASWTCAQTPAKGPRTCARSLSRTMCSLLTCSPRGSSLAMQLCTSPLPTERTPRTPGNRCASSPST
jgi:citrate lyase gamma subunit